MECPSCDFESTELGVKLHHAKGHGKSIAGFKTECEACGESMLVSEKRRANKDTYCSMSCQNAGGRYEGNQETKRVKKECKNGCGETVSRPPSQVPESGNLFCSKGCETDYRHRNWEGDSYRYYGANWSDQSDKAKRRAGGVCEDPRCDKTTNLEAHHIIPWRFFDEDEKANDLENLLVLCKKHHGEVEPFSRDVKP